MNPQVVVPDDRLFDNDGTATTISPLLLVIKSLLQLRRGNGEHYSPLYTSTSTRMNGSALQRRLQIHLRIRASRGKLPVALILYYVCEDELQGDVMFLAVFGNDFFFPALKWLQAIDQYAKLYSHRSRSMADKSTITSITQWSMENETMLCVCGESL